MHASINQFVACSVDRLLSNQNDHWFIGLYESYQNEHISRQPYWSLDEASTNSKVFYASIPPSFPSFNPNRPTIRQLIHLSLYLSIPFPKICMIYLPVCKGRTILTQQPECAMWVIYFCYLQKRKILHLRNLTIVKKTSQLISYAWI